MSRRKGWKLFDKQRSVTPKGKFNRTTKSFSQDVMPLPPDLVARKNWLIEQPVLAKKGDDLRLLGYLMWQHLDQKRLKPAFARLHSGEKMDSPD